MACKSDTKACAGSVVLVVPDEDVVVVWVVDDGVVDPRGLRRGAALPLKQNRLNIRSQLLEQVSNPLVEPFAPVALAAEEAAVEAVDCALEAGGAARLRPGRGPTV